MLGNWSNPVIDRDADGADEADATDAKEPRVHNQANELTDQDPNNNGSADLDHTFDYAGNMRTQEIGLETSPTTITYTHDLWNRLTGVVYGASSRAVYAYNGLNWRVEKEADKVGTFTN